MSPPTSSSSPTRGRGVITIILIVVVLIPLAYSVVSRVVAQDAEPADLFLERPDPKHKECVRDTEYMRFHHWELLRSTREEVVRYGIRGEVSLHGCRDCHTSRERFCDRCHQATSLTPDCWGCHYYP
jgi:hypothetical protein